MKFAVIGDPVEHSLSPRLFRWLFDELGVDADYSAMRVRAQDLPDVVNQVRSGALDGVSITLPHKEAVVRLVDEIDPSGSQIGAVNCLARTGSNRVIGHNSDGLGFRSALEQGGASLSGARMLLLGAGGAARAAAFTAAASGVRRLTIANRTPERAFSLSRDLVLSGLAHEPGFGRSSRSANCSVAVLPLPSPLVTGESGDIVVNATSVGLETTDADPLPDSFQLSSKHAVLDMVYRPLETRLLSRARAAGAIAVDGLWMLIHQALEQFRLWTSRPVPAELAARAHSALCKEAAR